MSAPAELRMPVGADRVYINLGNPDVTALIDAGSKNILDIGCGAGDNARLIKAQQPACRISGVTYSANEAEIARLHMDECWVFDIEHEIPASAAGQRFDTLLFSHVLEHMRNPAQVLARFSKLLVPGGTVLIAVPNVLVWRQRIRFFLGSFEYESAGIMDDTHLRFFTFFTAEEYLLAQTPELKVVYKAATGSFPLWWLRRKVFAKSRSDRIDAWATRHWPNLFGAQVLIKAAKSGSTNRLAN